jgi:uncharacterized membrane protein HdeD (DUF308 family)
LLLVAGVAQIILAFRSGGMGESIMLVVLGLLGIVAGGYMLSQPGLALGVLTLFLAGFFIAEGIIEIIAAIRARPAPGWGWFLFGGVLSLLLGLMVWRQFPLSGAWAIGTLVGVRLLMSGVSLVAIGSSIKNFATEAREDSGV